mmetsp:Transcript_7959/g.10446  ORF Transcript_7959/g.10446 Transcript_7959/m.10446 type:complete len:106 (+) Transcript_7959:149-466(+)|eukprot:CAMPEP_0198139766 /NCGR_PEP_ID=MMETSP1443-20131203/3006_1 /TAXON_ID=186043 /ORGANISM="Entomoneis sp., Strain CCMP2396" /LENGTH=105 /DNA_ID=CAMNT_0043801983 /DNA_START=147 /DNA_END=464 /DNA_ORIENTATION=-
MLSGASSRALTRAVIARRPSQSVAVVRNKNLSTAASEPKMHKAKGNWSNLIKSKRNIDHDDAHTVFHGPFNPATVWAICIGVVGGGIGAMEYGTYHQQKKQGFYK